jgi:hypothetical protein
MCDLCLVKLQCKGTIQALQGIFEKSTQSDGFSAVMEVSMLQHMQFILQLCPPPEQGPV